MTYEIYRYIFVGGAVLAGIMFAVSVFVFFFLKIPTVIGDLTGANARKAIANIRNLNESTGEKTYRTSAVNRERGKLTEKITPSGRLLQPHSRSLHGAMGTEKIGTQRTAPKPEASATLLDTQGAAGTTVLGAGGNETTLLDSGIGAASETTLLGGNETSVLGGAVGTPAETTVMGGNTYGAPAETTVLGGSVGAPAETTVLSGASYGVPSETTVLTPMPTAATEVADVFVVEYEITYIHTDEIIALG